MTPLASKETIRAAVDALADGVAPRHLERIAGSSFADGWRRGHFAGSIVGAVKAFLLFLALLTCVLLVGCGDDPWSAPVESEPRPGQAEAVKAALELYGVPADKVHVWIRWVVSSDPDSCGDGTGVYNPVDRGCVGGWQDRLNNQIAIVWPESGPDLHPDIRRNPTAASRLAHELRHWVAPLETCTVEMTDAECHPGDDWKPGGLVQQAATAIQRLPL